MGLLPDEWTRLSEIDHCPYRAQCMEHGIISVEGLLGQCMSVPEAVKAWFGCSDDEWRDLLVLLMSAAPVFAEEVYGSEFKKYVLGAHPPEGLDKEE